MMNRRQVNGILREKKEFPPADEHHYQQFAPPRLPLTRIDDIESKERHWINITAQLHAPCQFIHVYLSVFCNYISIHQYILIIFLAPSWLYAIRRSVHLNHPIHTAHMKCFTWIEAPLPALDIHNNESGFVAGVAIYQSISICIRNYLTARCLTCTAKAGRRHRSSYVIRISCHNARDHFLENELKIG